MKYYIKLQQNTYLNKSKYICWVLIKFFMSLLVDAGKNWKIVSNLKKDRNVYILMGFDNNV